MAGLLASIRAARWRDMLASATNARRRGVGSIIVLSGPVGAGKTTVARQMARSADAPTVLVEGDVFWTCIAKGHPGRPRQQGFQTLMRAMIRAAAAFAAEDFQVILDFTIPPWFLSAA